MDEAAYAYLLGVYLGDGWLSSHRGSQHRLRVALDAQYPLITFEVAQAMSVLADGHRVDRRLKATEACIVVGSYGAHRFELFPQHGPGPKHTRPIALERWQDECVDAFPELFVRGLFQTDRGRTPWHSLMNSWARRPKPTARLGARRRAANVGPEWVATLDRSNFSA